MIGLLMVFWFIVGIAALPWANGPAMSLWLLVFIGLVIGLGKRSA